MGERFFKGTCVRDIHNLIVKCPAVAAKENTVDEVLERVMENPKRRHVYVVDKQNRLIGAIRFRDMVENIFADTVLREEGDMWVLPSRFSRRPESAGALMISDPPSVKEATPLTEAIRIMIVDGINELPVVSDDGNLVGEINMFEIIAGYLARKRTSSSLKR